MSDSESSPLLAEMRRKFEENLKTIKLRSNSSLIANADAYDLLISEVEYAKTKPKKNYKDYRRLKRYDVLSTGDTKNLILPLIQGEKDIKFYVHNEQLFDIIHAAHLETGHGGKHRLEHNIRSKYANITRDAVVMYLELCHNCKQKKTHLKKYSKRLIISELNYLATIEVVDMQGSNDGDYKFVLYYEEHVSKFILLKPMKSNESFEVVQNLIDMFCILGAPAVLHCNISKEFCTSIKNEIKNKIPDLKIMYKKLRHSQKDNLKNMVDVWMKNNNSSSWSDGLKFCQWKYNSTRHAEIQQAPYEVMYGRKIMSDIKDRTISETVDVVSEMEEGHVIGSPIVEVEEDSEPLQTVDSDEMSMNGECEPGFNHFMSESLSYI